MSELKALWIPTRSGNSLHCYLKDEADKVIAELKADYKEVCGRLQTANLIKDEQLAAARHHKYKRCLAMAKWCEERCARYDLLQEHSGFSWRREIDFYFRWYQRWLELAEMYKNIAEKFKEEAK